MPESLAFFVRGLIIQTTVLAAGRLPRARICEPLVSPP